MALLKIARLGHPILRQKAQPLAENLLNSSEIQNLIESMIETMRDAEGVGLAAPQVHFPLRIIIVEVRPDNPRYPQQECVPLTVLVNPEIVFASEDQEMGWEGCLSIPDLRGVVPRAVSVVVRGLDREGREVTIEAHHFFARVLQHEIDHLDGIVFLDRMKDLSTLTFLNEFERFWASEEEAT